MSDVSCLAVGLRTHTRLEIDSTGVWGCVAYNNDLAQWHRVGRSDSLALTVAPSRTSLVASEERER